MVLQGPQVGGPISHLYALTINGTPETDISPYGFTQNVGSVLMLVGQGIEFLPEGATITLRNIGNNNDTLVSVDPTVADNGRGPGNSSYFILKRVGS